VEVGAQVPGDPFGVTVELLNTRGHTLQGGDGGQVGIPDAYRPANHLPPNRKLMDPHQVKWAGGDGTIPLYRCLQDK